MGNASLKQRIRKLEQRRSELSPTDRQFDDDAITIYCVMPYFDATLEPTYHDVEPLPLYARGKALRDARYGRIIPACLDEPLKRYTRASGEFQLAFGREPQAGDLLRYEHVCADPQG